jgi:pimeloyl-ACP methyl ester carboxylesterase
VSATSALGADVHALVVATAANDVIVSFRGMDTLRDLEFEDTVIAPDYNATYFGPAAAAFAAKAKAKAKAQKGVSGVSGGGGGQQRPQQAVADPDEFWILKGYAEAYEAIEAPVRELVTKWGVPATAKLWLTGHSDGSQLAQIAALRAAAKFGADAVAGVVLFGPSRVGSRAFADYYASTGLGARTTYYSYGRDPAANGDYTVAQGLEFPGTGLYACPFSEAATERLVVVPPGTDRDGVCTELKAVSSWLSRLAPPDVLPGVDTSDPALDSLSSYEYLAQHIPSVTYDGLMRLLLASPALAAPSKCELAALGLASCVVSNKCSAALRPASAVKCRGCASDATCSSYWGMGAGARCDRANSELSSWLCYGGGGGAAPVPPTLAGLFWGKNGGSAAETMPQLRFVNPLANRRNPFVQNQQRVG